MHVAEPYAAFVGSGQRRLLEVRIATDRDQFPNETYVKSLNDVACIDSAQSRGVSYERA